MGQQKRGLYKRNIVWQGRAWSPGEGILTVYGEQNSGEPVYKKSGSC